MEKINLEEIIYDSGTKWDTFKRRFPETSDCIISAMREACRQTLELAAENADIYIPDGAYMDCYVDANKIEINKQSIIDVINLVE